MKQLIGYFLCFFCLSSNAQTWNWSKQIKIQNVPWTVSNEFAMSFTDGSNIYVAGNYGGNFFGSTDTFASLGMNDLFIAKFDNSGVEQWIRCFGGNNTGGSDFEDIHAFYHPLNQDIYISGKYINDMWLDTSYLPSHYLDSADIFMARMDVNGNFKWARNFGSIGTDFARVYCKPDGNLLMVGGVRVQTSIDAFQINPGVFIAEFDQDGTCLWAQNKMNLGNIDTYNIVAEFLGKDIILAGHFNANNGFIDTISISTNGFLDAFICRMDSLGNVKWVNTYGGPAFGNEAITHLAITSNQDILFTMRFCNSFYLDTAFISTSQVSSLIAKVTSAGRLIWVNDIQSAGNSGGAGEVRIVTDGSIYFTGAYAGSAIFGNDTLISYFNTDIFLARYDDSGSCMGVIDFGEGGGYNVEQDVNGNIFSMGYFNNTVSFNSNTYTSMGPRDLYLAKLSGSVGVGENQRVGAGELLIYGNPNAGIFTIELPTSLKPNKPFQLSIINSSGKVSYFNEVSAEGDIDLDTDLPNGLYTVTVLQGSKFYSGKMVIAD